jgi:hypothetical protein
MNQQKIRELAGRSGGHFYFESLASRPAQKREGVSFTFEQLEAFAKLVAEKSASVEREACAKVCDEHGKVWAERMLLGFQATLDDAADAIRARGQA